MTLLFSTMVLDPYPHGIVTDPIYVRGKSDGPLERWLASRPDQEAEAFRKVLENGLVHARGPRNAPMRDEAHDPARFCLPGPLTIRIERIPATDWRNRRLTISDAADLVREPVHVCVENRRTDARFVLHLADSTTRGLLEQRMDRPHWIQAVGGGTGELEAWLDELLAGNLTPDKWRRVLRGWMLLDRDAGDRDARQPSRNTLKLLDLCMKVTDRYGEGLSWICLARRESESYVPDKGLRAEETDRQKKFVDRLIDWRGSEDRKEWAWAVDLKNGFHGDLLPTWAAKLSKTDRDAIKRDEKPLEPAMLKAPFNSCSAIEIDDMKRGFGQRRLGERLRDKEAPPPWVRDIATEYDRGPDLVRRPVLVQSLLDRM